MRSSALSLTTAALFAAFLAVCAMIAVPLPLTSVPVTLLTLGLFLTGLLLPPRTACTAAVLHLLLGLAGLPVFSGMTGGPGVLLGPTGGFLLAGPVAVWCIARLTRSTPAHPFRVWGALCAGLFLLDTAGTLWYCAVTGIAPGQGLLFCVLPFLPADVLKMALAAAMHRILNRHTPPLPR